jgi:hypothetical protein
MRILLELCYMVGLLMFLYLGGAGAYELLGRRKWRASLLIAGALLWVVTTFMVFGVLRATLLFPVVAPVYLVATFFLARKVHRELGKPDIR